MEDVLRDFFLHTKVVFQGDKDEFVNNDNMLDDHCLMEWLDQLMYSIQENDHKH